MGQVDGNITKNCEQTRIAKLLIQQQTQQSIRVRIKQSGGTKGGVGNMRSGCRGQKVMVMGESRLGNDVQRKKSVVDCLPTGAAVRDTIANCVIDDAWRR